jgi:hypothetical protein
MLCDDRGLLRVYDLDDEGWLHLLPDDQQHAGLLRLLSGSLEKRFRHGSSRRVPGGASGHPSCTGYLKLKLREGPCEIVAQVLDVFDSDAQANGPVVHSLRRPDPGRNARVGHGARAERRPMTRIILPLTA